MGIELPPELADVAAQAGVAWPEADEEAMATQAQTWRDTATGVATLATDADTTARNALSSVSGEAADKASAEWKTFVEADSGHLTSLVRDANDAADRLEHAANQVGTAKVEIVRNLVGLAQNTDAAHAAAQAGHPFALAGLDTAVRGTAANVANIESNLISAVQPTSGVDMAAVQNPVNANPGHHLLPGTVTDAVAPLAATVTETAHHATETVGATAGGVVGDATDLVRQGGNVVGATTDQVAPGAGDLVRHATGTADQVVTDAGNAAGQVASGATDLVRPGAGAAAGAVDHVLPGGHPGDVLPDRPGGPGLPPGDPEITGPVPADDFPGDAPTPPTGETVQSGFAGGLEPSAAAPANLPPAPAAAPQPANPAAPGLGGAPFAGAPAAPPVAGGPPPAAGAPAPGAAPAPARPTAFAPAAAPIAGVADRPQDPAPRKQTAGPPGAPPPAKGERDGVLTAFWLHMFPIGHLPVASYRPARQLPPPPEELDYAAGLRFEPADHPQFNLVDTTPRLAEIAEAVKAANPPPAATQDYAPPPVHPPQPNPAEADTIPNLRPVTPSAGLTADHPTVHTLLENHDPLGGGHERDWDRRYLVRLGSVTAHGISPEGLEYNWPTSEQYPEGGSAPGDPEVLDEGAVIDRFGTPHGRVFAGDSTPFPRRSLPPDHKDAGYRRYRVTKPLPVWRAVSAAWFGQPGGGIRYRTTHSAVELVALGYLEEFA